MSGSLRIGIVGGGAIGGTVRHLLEQGAAAGCSLSGVVTRRSKPADLDALIERSDAIVEAAGHEALAALGPNHRSGC